MARNPKLTVQIDTDASKAQTGIQATSKKFATIGKAAGIVGAAIAAAGIGKKALDFAKDSVKAASDTQQAFGAVESVFGRNAKVIQNWSKSAAKAYGLSSAEAAQMAAITGAQLQGLGFDLASSTKLTQQLTARAADMAATFGGTTAEALEAVGSLLNGQRDPIEKYGVSIRQTGINAVLAAKGQDKLTGAARQQAEAQAALKILFDKTSSSAGAFGRESNTLAGQQQRLKASMDNLKATIGAALLPALTALARFMTAQVVPALTRTWTWIQTRLVPALRAALTPALNQARAAFTSLKISMDKLGVTNKQVTQLLKALTAAALTPLVVTLNAAAAAARALAKWFEITATAARAVADAAKSVVSWLGRIKAPTINWPKPPSWIPGIGGKSITVPAPARLGGLTRAAATAPAGRATQSQGGIVINVTGALDPEAVARQIRAILISHSRRVGSVATL